MPYTVDCDNCADPILNDFFLSLAAPGTRSSGTWSTYAEQLSLFFRFLKSRNKSWTDANQVDLRHYYRLRRIGKGNLKISASSWNVFTAACRRFYSWTVRNDHIPTAPFDFKDVPSGSDNATLAQTLTTTKLNERVGKRDIKYLTEEDFCDRLLPAVTRTRHAIRNALFVRLLMRSGLRADEAVNIKVSALPNPDDPKFAGRKTCSMQVLGKGQKKRTVVVPKSWLRDAQRYIEWDRADVVDRCKKKTKGKNVGRSGDNGYLFLTAKGTPVTYSAVYDMLRIAGEKAGFNFKSHPHMLRHSFAIYQLSAMIKALLSREQGCASSTENAYRRMIQDPLKKLQDLMGHSSITTTFIYLDYVDDIDDIADVTSDAEAFGSEDGYEDMRGMNG